MNIKKYMREGKSAEDVLYNEGQPKTFEYYDDLALPVGHVITYTNEHGGSTNYWVKSVISTAGSCSITYLMRGTTVGDFKVMKEFCPRYHGIRRRKIKDAQGNSAEIRTDTDDNKLYKDYQLDYDENDDDIKLAENKFKREPVRVLDLLETDEPGVEDRARNMHLARPHSHCFEFQGNLYYLLDYVKGISLFEFIMNKGKSISFKQKVSIMEQLCKALTHLHKECVHMDVSPFNILVKEEKNGDINLTLIDFGLATSIIHHADWGSLHDKGTPNFTDTESYLDSYKKIHEIKAEPAPILVLDIYSVGMIWFYLLHAGQFQDVDKNTMMEVIGRLKRNISTEIRNAKDKWMKNALELAYKSISYDNSKESDEAFEKNCYGPFCERPKTAGEWYGELEVINRLKEPYIKFGCNSPLVIPANKKEESVELTFDTNRNWVASADKWLEGWRPQGNAGEQTFQLIAESNKDLQLRGTKITVTAKVDQEELSQEIAVVQPGCGIVLQDGQSFEFSADGETKLLKFKTGSTYTYSWKKNESNWLKSEELEQQNGWNVIQLEAEENKTKDSQEAVLEINCCDNLMEVPFTQPKILQVPKIDLVTNTPLEFPANDSDCTVRLEFKTNADWNIECTEPWRILSEISGEPGTQIVQFAASPNESLQKQVGEVTIKASLDGQECTKVVACLQPGCGIEIEPNPTIHFPAKGKDGELRFRAAGEASVTIEGPDSDWLEYKGLSRDEKDWMVVHLKAQPNSSEMYRYAKVHINCCGNEEVLEFIQEKDIPKPSHYVKIKEGQLTCFNAAKGTYDLVFKATGPWTAYVEGNPDWIQIQNKKGTDNGTLKLLVKKNTSILNRDSVKLVIDLDNGMASDFVTLNQKGREDNPFDWAAFWQKVRIPTYVLSAVFLVGGLYALWEWQKPVLKVHEESHKTLVHNVTSTGWDFDAKDTWTAEVVDGTWAFIPQRTGESGTNRLNVEFKENSGWAVREATIRLTCQDKSELMTIRQLYSREDSLNDVLTKYRERYEKGDKSGFNDIYMRLYTKNSHEVFRLKDGSRLGNNTYIIQGKNKDCRIGDTHKVIAFKQNADSLITEIIVAPINE